MKEKRPSWRVSSPKRQFSGASPSFSVCPRWSLTMTVFLFDAPVRNGVIDDKRRHR
jgi:hypothetical protein